MRGHVRGDQLRVFWRLIRRGCSVEEAAGRVGFGSAAGHRWFGEAGGMPPLSLVEPARARKLTIVEREHIAQGLGAENSIRQIAKELGRHPSTVLRELRKNMHHQQYRRRSGTGFRLGRRGSIHRIKPSCAPTRRQAGPSKRSWQPIRGCAIRCKIGWSINTVRCRSRGGCWSIFLTMRRCGCPTKPSTNPCMCKAAARCTGS